jgi:hypothetical protein
MKKLLLAFTAITPSFFAQAQTTLFTENFESGTSGQFTLNTTDMSSTSSGVNDWIVNNVYTGGTGSLICLGFPFSYTIGSTATQPGAITGSPTSYYMHLRSDEAAADGILCSSYIAADGICNFAENNFSRMSSDISTMGYTAVSLKFWWACGGAAGTNYGEVYYSTNGGAAWTLLTAPLSQYQGQATWIQQTITLPAFDNQTTLRFGFRFVNNTTTAAADPSFQLDDIVIAGNGCSPTGLSTGPTICQGQSYFAQGANQTTSGTYYDTLVNSCGQDSVITTTLTVTPVNINVTTAGITLTATATPATYQWINCGTMAAVGGATNQNFTPSANGSYAVAVTQSGCTDTSLCTPVTGVGLSDLNNTFDYTVSPNPFSEQTIIRLNNIQTDQLVVRMTDALGKIVNAQIQKDKNTITISRQNLGKGLYIVQLYSGTQNLGSIKIIAE